MLRTVLTGLVLGSTLAGATAALARPTTQAEMGRCAFCEPHFVRTEPVFVTGPQTPHMVAFTDQARPYTRFDVEGIRMLQRMR